LIFFVAKILQIGKTALTGSIQEENDT